MSHANTQHHEVGAEDRAGAAWGRGGARARLDPHEVSSGRLPDFVVIGAMKAGTTTLFEYLCRHPKVFMCTPKEPQFFSREHVFARGWDWYFSQFADARDDQLCGEASTCYSRYPHFGDVPQRLREHVPDAKFVYQMRHPVDRAYSHYRHLMQERELREEPILTFEEALEAIPQIIDASLYLMQIARYLKHFSRDRFFFLTLDEYQQHPERVLAGLQGFLGVEVMDLHKRGPIRANPSGDMILHHRWRRMLDRARHAPGVSLAVNALPPPARARLRAWTTNLPLGKRLVRSAAVEHQRKVSPLRPETRRRLLERFAEPNRELQAFLGQDLSAWSR